MKLATILTTAVGLAATSAAGEDVYDNAITQGNIGADVSCIAATFPVELARRNGGHIYETEVVPSAGPLEGQQVYTVSFEQPIVRIGGREQTSETIITLNQAGSTTYSFFVANSSESDIGITSSYLLDRRNGISLGASADQMQAALDAYQAMGAVAHRCFG